VRLVLATRNRGKLEELRALLEPLGHELLDLDDAGIPPDESEDELEAYPTFEENALAKARHFFARAGGLGVLADDSGLEVRALGGRPGVHSKRYSGRTDLSGRALDAENNARLLAALASERDRSARFVCAAALVTAAGEVVARGTVDGRVLEAPRGTEGFGYDPLFFATELGRTFGEAGIAEKERVSHRARAFRALVDRVLRPGVRPH
jgi:XTP/dITP diphosphohydrolase